LTTLGEVFVLQKIQLILSADKHLNRPPWLLSNRV
jgi:hypothetical protein